MAGRNREPTDLVIAKGRKHLTKAEIADRKSKEVKVDFLDIEAPKYLSKRLKEEFEDLGCKLLLVGIMTELDEDALARFLLAKDNYVKYTKRLNQIIRTGTIDEIDKMQTIQDKAFKQCRAAANDLGLTITSRCKLIVPQTPEPPKENKFSKFASDGK